MYSGAPTLDSAGTAPAGLSLGLLGAQRFRSCLCLPPASSFGHSDPASASSPGSFWDGWCPWGRAVLLSSKWHLCVNSSCGPFWELGEATGAALASLWPGWCWKHGLASSTVLS